MPSNKPKASTQEHLDIDDITEDLILLKNGNVAQVMTTTAVNFDILSEAEQDATIYAYGALLNSLSFPLQILVRSKKADISSYFAHLEDSLKNQSNPALKGQIKKYMGFIQTVVQQRTVLDKKFYLVITFSTLEMGIKGLRRSKNNRKVESKAALIQDAKVALAPKRDHLIKQTARLGLSTRQLTTKELIELFYDIYNPAMSGTQRVAIDSASFAPVVEPAVEIPTPAPTSPPAAQVGTAPIPPQQEIPPGQEDKPPTQEEALKNLQEATRKASGFVSGQPPDPAKQ